MRTLVVLTLAQSFAQTGVPIVVLLGGIVGSRIAPERGPCDAADRIHDHLVPPCRPYRRRCSWVALAASSGFMLGTAYATASGLFAAWAVAEGHFVMFCLATFFIGSNNAFIQQYRFAVADSVPSARVGPSLSVLMMAGVVAAWLGPEVASRLHHALEWGEFTGSFVGLSALMACAFVLLLFYPDTPPDEPETPTRWRRPLATIAAQPVFLLAVGAAVVGYAVMSLVMTATPVSMHTIDHFDMDSTTWVIQSHIMAMYLPSLFSGLLIARFGAMNVIVAGLALMMACIGIALVDRSLMHYWGALVLLGIGWNFLFVGGTTLLTRAYEPHERFRVQALNEALVFGMQAVARIGFWSRPFDAGLVRYLAREHCRAWSCCCRSCSVARWSERRAAA
ncbi:MAG: MFS transporter [Gammaproteobacteria bacterium]|nr:MFS transporter [Gammaproteobacteria bacterium]